MMAGLRVETMVTGTRIEIAQAQQLDCVWCMRDSFYNSLDDALRDSEPGDVIRAYKLPAIPTPERVADALCEIIADYSADTEDPSFGFVACMGSDEVVSDLFEDDPDFRGEVRVAFIRAAEVMLNWWGHDRQAHIESDEYVIVEG